MSINRLETKCWEWGWSVNKKHEKNRGVFNWIPANLLADWALQRNAFQLMRRYSFLSSHSITKQFHSTFVKPFSLGLLLFTCRPSDRMEASQWRCCSSKSFKLFWILSALLATGLSLEFPRQGRQRVALIDRTVTVAVTEVAFETKPTLCISLINATRPCVGRQAQWSRIPSANLAEAGVQPTFVQS